MAEVSSSNREIEKKDAICVIGKYIQERKITYQLATCKKKHTQTYMIIKFYTGIEEM